MAAHPRYRVENGDHCVDVRLTSLEQMFDNRDPAPFRERDLDPDLVDYLTGAAEDLVSHGRFRIVFWFPTARPKDDVGNGFRAHFAAELQIHERQRRRHRRTSQVSLLIAVALLVVLQALAEIVLRFPDTSLRHAVREGLVILSWVVLWRPVDLLVYEWIPARRQRKLLRRLHDAAIDVREGDGPPDDPDRYHTPRATP